jgi:C1A family cysteine protease
MAFQNDKIGDKKAENKYKKQDRLGMKGGFSMKKILAICLACLMTLQLPNVIRAESTIDSSQEGKGRGYVPSKIEIKYKEGTERHTKLPSKFIPKEAAADLADYKAAVTPVQNQGTLGTCWIFATYGNMESFLKTQTGVEYDFSENHMKYVSTNSDSKNPYRFDYSAYTGGNFWMSLAYLTRGTAGGPVLDAEDPYDEKTKRDLDVTLQKPRTDHYVEAAKMLGDLDYDVISKDWWKTSEHKSYIKDMKAMIKKYGAIYSCYSSSTGTYHTFQYQDGSEGLAYLSNVKSVKSESSIPSPDHAITVVGWDDGFEKENFQKSSRPTKDGAFLVKNSWGETWGEHGYFWISYEELFQHTCSVTKMTTRSSLYDHLYEYDTLGCTSSLVGFEDEITYMNQYWRETSKQQKVTAVSSYFMKGNITADVYVSPTRDAKDLVKVASKKISNAGYEVIHLDKEITVTDSRYLVAIELSSDEEYLEYPLEDKMPGFSSKAEASDRQSYIGGSISDVKDGKYKDLTKKDGWEDANVCLKAYTKDTGKTLKSLSAAKVTGYGSKTYTGKGITQDPTVKLDGKTLKKGRDYRIAYNDWVSPGIATMTIVGNGEYCSSAARKYKILPKAPKISSITSSSKGKLTLKWNRPYKADGFEVYIKKPGSSKYVKVRTTTKTSTTITDLKSKKKHYVKVRAYRKAGKEKVYSYLSLWRSRTIK